MDENPGHSPSPSSTSSSSSTIRTLHYALPVAIAAYFIAHQSLAFLLRLPRPKACSRRLRSVAVCANFALLATYVADAALFVAHALVRRGWWAPQHAVLHVLCALLVWGCLTMALLDAGGRPRWGPFLGAWLTATAGEVVLCALARLPRGDGWEEAGLGVEVLRITVLTAVSACGLVATVGRGYAGAVAGGRDVESVGKKKKANGHAVARSDQTTPLLGDGGGGSDGEGVGSATENGDAESDHTNRSNGPTYGTLPDDDEDDDDDDDEEENSSPVSKADKELKDKLQKRIDEEGYLGYLKGFLIFLPYLWPSKNRRVQLHYVLLGLLLLVERAMNVLEPRQEGIVINRLTEVAGTGELPWKDIGVWLGLVFVNSYSVRGQLQAYLEFHVDNWSYQQMVDLCFGHVMNLGMDFHDNKDSGEIIKAVDQANALNELLRVVFFDMAPILLDLAVALWYVSALFDVYFTYMILAMATTYFIITYKGAAWSARMRRKSSERMRNISKVQYESISNWATVSYFNRASFEHGRLMGSVRDALRASAGLFRTNAVLEFSKSFCIYFGQVAMNLLAAYRVSRGDQPIGNFVTLNSYFGVFVLPLYVLSYRSRDITNYLVDAERVLQVLQTQPTITDKDGAAELRVPAGTVTFTDVGFRYDERKASISDVSFTARPGQTVALVGETGSGKSTLFKLLYRFYDVSAGAVTIDGQDVRDVTLRSLRDALGMVPQDATLFNVSIMENVRYARLDASDADVHAACRAAAIHDKIMSFPDGYATKVGERGVKLSGGELQRVSIARVLLKKPKIVLLDEATSAVDSKTEREIQDAFRSLAEGRTTFVIAHRLSTIMDADMILVVDKGKIVERGTHDELLEKKGRYHLLWETQTEKHKKKVKEADKLLDI